MQPPAAGGPAALAARLLLAAAATAVLAPHGARALRCNPSGAAGSALAYLLFDTCNTSATTKTDDGKAHAEYYSDAAASSLAA